ncbi:MAG: HYR domain-containing protein [Bacteroidia bacterium]|nr:HYR domain-containing protein [Bacteroidia bacterium]
MKNTFHNLTGVSSRTIATAVLGLFITGASYGSPRINTITFDTSSLTACIPAVGTVSVSYTVHSVRGKNGTINGVYVLSGLPAGVTADAIAGFTSIGNNPFPDRTLTLNISSTALAGIHSFSIQLYNSQGVTDQATVTGTLILNLAPAFTSSPSSIITNTAAGTCSATVNYTATASGFPAPTLSYIMSGATTASGNGSGSGVVFNRGVTNVTITASNVCSPAATASFSVTVNDNEAPVFTNLPASMTINCDASSDASNTGNATATDNCTGVSMSYSDASTQNADVNNAAHYNYSITRTFTATDENNNSSNYEQVITVQDITAPSVTCAENATRPTATGLCSYIVSGSEFDAAASADNCSAVSLTYTLSGATTATGSSSLDGIELNKGTTTIMWTATDVSGNFSACGFYVTVNDMESPIIGMPQNIVTANTEGLCGALIHFDILFADNCEGAKVTQESGRPSDSEFPMGTTVNMFTVTDASGNTASGSFTVTVYDNEPPTIVSITTSDFNGYNVSCSGSCNGSATIEATDNCSAAITYLWDNGQTTPTATDLCGGAHSVMISDGTNTNFAEIIITRPEELDVYAGPDAVTYYGYGNNQNVVRTALVVGGVPPYSYSWTMNRSLMCNMITNAGDELFSSETVAENPCPESPMNFIMAALPVCTGSETLTAVLLDNAEVTVTVTDANGCSATSSFKIAAEDVRCFAGNSTTAKVQMCHRTGTATNPWIQICVDPDAVASHLAHGDYLGLCGKRMDASVNVGSSELKVYPNPNNGNFTLDFQSDNTSNEDLLVQIKSVAGNVVYSKTISATDGHFEGVLHSGDLDEGFYIVNIQQGAESVNQTIVIMK